MPVANCNGVDIAFEVHGRAEDPVLLLIQGLGMPLAAWPPAMLDSLADNGYRVVTFDNRDVGKSQQMTELEMPNVLLQLIRRRLGFSTSSPYQLDDMADDAFGVLDALGIKQAHVVGVSMGGMIAQQMAIAQQDRLKSLTSIMSTTGNPRIPGPSKPVSRHIVRGPSSRTTEGRIEYHRQLWRLIGSPAYPLPDDELDGFLNRIIERGMTTAGTARQMLAINAARNRVPDLRNLRVPTLVIHGTKDPLVHVEGGRDTANAIPGARLIEIDGMGHDLPAVLLPKILSAVTEHAARSSAGSNS